MTHNLELKMPEILFDGATFRITPRSFEGEGTLFKFEMIPKDLAGTDVEGRLFGLKKISKKFNAFKSKCTDPHHFQIVLVNWPSNKTFNMQSYDQCTSTMEIDLVFICRLLLCSVHSVCTTDTHSQQQHTQFQLIFNYFI